MLKWGMARFLTTEQARAFYDRFGARQDRQGFYENVALGALIRHGDFEDAERVFEFGCGTGRFAAELLAGPLPEGCRYLGVDISTTMVSLAGARLKPWAGRAEAELWKGEAPPGSNAAFDRFVSTYVLDLLAPAAIEETMAMAHAMLVPGGKLCLVALTEGRSAPARMVSWLWKAVHACHPVLVGGCRPVRLLPFLANTVGGYGWRVEHHQVVDCWGISSEVLVASPH